MIVEYIEARPANEAPRKVNRYDCVVSFSVTNNLHIVPYYQPLSSLQKWRISGQTLALQTH